MWYGKRDRRKRRKNIFAIATRGVFVSYITGPSKVFRAVSKISLHKSQKVLLYGSHIELNKVTEYPNLSQLWKGNGRRSQRSVNNYQVFSYFHHLNSTHPTPSSLLLIFFLHHVIFVIVILLFGLHMIFDLGLKGQPSGERDLLHWSCYIASFIPDIMKS